ncbi:GH25 family lysozyme, partial [Vibrio sp. FNV 38]|nr:GH25 family lysozyme [Vibrio sp. FNV 38]
TEGGLFEDAWFHANMKGAADNGLRCGVYFFSQAVTVAEAIEEAQFVLDRLADYRVTMPVVYDWEYVDAENARTNDLTVDGRTDCAVAFCETIRRAGYTPCVYFNRKLGYYGYDLTRLTDYDFWFSLPESPF